MSHLHFSNYHSRGIDNYYITEVVISLINQLFLTIHIFTNSAASVL